MSRWPLSVCIVAATLLPAVAVVTSAQSTLPATVDEVASGKQVFATSCANSFCHGSEGGPGRGPSLRGRDWQQSYLYRTIEEGIPGSAMPAWKGRLSEEQIHAVTRYILSISHEITGETKALLASSSPSPPTVSAATAGPVARGKEQFFDLSKERNCAVCHRVHEAGLNLGPSLDALSTKSISALLASILQLQVVRGVEVRTTSGERLCGIKAAEDSKALRVYDIPPAGPPVLRSFSLQDIVSRGHCDDLQPHSDVASSYTRQQLADIAAFLKSTQSAP